MKKTTFAVLSLAISLQTVPSVALAELCGGPLSNNNFDRPLDYTSAEDRYGWSEGQKNKLALVENAHFTAEVEQLLKGVNGPLPGDIHYTLMHWPNHYRALNAMANWHLQNPNPKDEECDCIEWLLPPECYFTRAITFKPKDPMLYYVLGVYLHKKEELDKAEDAYNDALRLGLNAPEFNYNYGLLMIDLGNYDRAMEFASKAYSQGVPFPGLRNKLQQAGRWQAAN